MSKLALFGGPKIVTTPFPTWPVYDDEDEKNLLDVLHTTNWWLYAYNKTFSKDGIPGKDFSHGDQFEHDFAAAQCVKHCHLVTSGTCDLEIALEACGIGPGDEVITTPLYLHRFLDQHPPPMRAARLRRHRLRNIQHRPHKN